MGSKVKGAHYMAGLAAGAAALAVLSTPIGMIELIVTSTGISETIHAAAPPLGMTARLLIAGFAALMTAGATLTFQKNSNMADPAADGDRKMGFALSKLTAFARGRGRGVNDDVPVLRRADAHPDAPARRPIFASRDFGGVEIFRPAAPPLSAVPPASPVTALVAAFYVEDEVEPIVDGAGLSLPNAPEPLPDAAMLALAAQAVAPVARVAPIPPVVETPVVQSPLPATVEAVEASIAQAEALIAPTLTPVGEASIADLAARFEQGLARRIALSEAAKAARHAETVLTRSSVATPPQPVLADLPTATPVAVRSDVDVEVEEALRAALGTLQRMTSRGR